jgi:hypothetical protein
LEWWTLGDRGLDGELTRRVVVVLIVTIATQLKGGMRIGSQKPYWAEVQPNGLLGQLVELPIGMDLRWMTELEALAFFTREPV